MEQHIISFKQGIHLTPSVAEEGQLGDCVNLIAKDGSLRNAPQLGDMDITLAASHTLTFIHRPNSSITNYITKATAQNVTSLYLHPATAAPIITLDEGVTINQVTSVGNTIIILSSDGMHYLLWKGNAYVNLGSHLPELLINFGINRASDATVTNRKDIDPDFNKDTFTHTIKNGVAINTIGFEEGYQTPFNNAIYGEVNKLMKEEVENKGYFANPFYIRYAYRLYDGSLTMHSAPIFINGDFDISVETEHEDGLLVDNQYFYYTNVGGNLDIHIAEHFDSDQAGDDPEIDLDCFWNFVVKRYRLWYKMMGNIQSEWSDIIKSVDIFISQPFYIYDQSGKIETVRHEIHENANEHWQRVIVDLPKVEHQDELVNDCGNFYFIKSVSVNEMDTDTHEMDTNGYLENLTARERMSDDYDSHDTLIPHYSFPYNQRLNIANITKSLFGGFNANMFSLVGGSDKLTMAVTIHTPEKDVSFKLEEIEHIGIPAELRYYLPSQYPASLQIAATINGNPVTQSIKLTSHKFLNGYYAVILKSAFENPESKTYEQLVADLPETSSDTTITLPNKLYTSEINNPFFFPVSGINTIGVGEIRGICAAVKALSQGQFGQFPLYVFATDGIWALEVSSEGKYSTKQPATREVCNNPNSITQTDNAVLYSTDRGLCVIQGSVTKLLTAQLEAATESLSQIANDYYESTHVLFPFSTATNLLTILTSASISYDGINNIAHVYPLQNNLGHWMLNLDTMEWTRSTDGSPDAFVDGYPNAALQIGNKLHNYQRTGIEQPHELRNGFLLTRETAFGNPMTMKVLNDLKIMRRFYPYTTISGTPAVETVHNDNSVKVIPYVSNDRTTWYRLNSLKGHSWKWYRFAIFTNLTDLDTLEGIVINTDLRRTNKLR